MPAQHYSGTTATSAVRQHCATFCRAKLLHDWLLLQKHSNCQSVLTVCMHSGVRGKAAPSACTFSYAPPEILVAFQLSNQFPSKTKKVNGVAADMWAAGCTLYRMLTGKFPFHMDETGPFEHRWQRFRAGHMGQESWVSPQRELVHMPSTSPCFTIASSPFLLCSWFHCAALKSHGRMLPHMYCAHHENTVQLLCVPIFLYQFKVCYVQIWCVSNSRSILQGPQQFLVAH